ncbi:hypothetical protein ACMFMG_008773 [Clarireedia jacksonii]
MAQQQQNRNSPHLNHLHQNGSAPSSPSMSNSQQGNPSRQTVSYPSPTSYPSPSLSTSQQYNYPPPGSQPVNEPYRASPTGSNASLPLPSMRSLDPLQQQQQQQQAAQHQMGSPLPPPVAQMGAPYYAPPGHQMAHPGHHYPNVTSDPNMRYPISVDARVMSGGRHKKCDEQHPACRNCQKSKRECLGYDPIFKQQPGPAAIQPAPSSAPAQASAVATANPYGHQPQMLHSYGPAAMPYDPALSAGASASAGQHFDYSSAIDPALEAAAPPPAAANFHNTIPGMPIFRDINRDMQSASPYSSGQSDTPHLRGGAGSPFSPTVASFLEEAADTTFPAKRSISDLLAIGGAPTPADPTPTDVSQSPNTLEEAKHLYYSIYAPGLENFLESKWFSVKGIQKLLADKSLLDQFGTLLLQFSKTTPSDQAQIAYTASVEARVVWALACMVKAGAADAEGVKEEQKGVIPATDDVVEANHRLTIFEVLLTGKVAESNPLTAPVPGSADHHRLRELEFWYTLANFVCLSDEDPSSSKEVNDTLGTLRNLLDGRENRDVLYSIAVIRAYAQRVPEYTPSGTPLHFDESDPRSKLLVAKKFISDEASGAGTTNVIRRLCELATRTWTTPAPLVPIPTK